MVSKNRSGPQVESLEGRRMLSASHAADGRQTGAETASFAESQKAAGSSVGEYCRAEEPGGCAAETLAALNPYGHRG